MVEAGGEKGGERRSRMWVKSQSPVHLWVPRHRDPVFHPQHLPGTSSESLSPQTHFCLRSTTGLVDLVCSGLGELRERDRSRGGCASEVSAAGLQVLA